MSDVINFLLSLSAIFPAIIGIVRFKQIDKSYYPFIYIICIGLIVEILNFIFMNRLDAAAQVVETNIFSLIDCLLYTLLFYRWGLFARDKKIFYSLVGVFIILWVIVTIVVTGIKIDNLYFRLFYSLTLIFFAVSYFNRLVVSERGNLLRNSKFLICIGLIVFYTFFAIFCATTISAVDPASTKDFRRGLQAINSVSNILVNLLYALAILWIPKKKIFLTAY